MIHDGARPFVSPAFIEKGISLMEMHDAIIPALPVKDTIKVVYKGRLCIKGHLKGTLCGMSRPRNIQNMSLSSRPIGLPGKEALWV